MEIRQDIKIGDFTYQVFLTKGKDKKAFKYIVNYELIDDFPAIKDVYFLCRDTNIVYPIPDTNGFSTVINDFNEDLSNINEIEDNTISLKYDTIRIYHPYNKPSLNGIVYIQALVNNINIHLYCNTLDKLSSKGETSFKIGNDVYSEYVEFAIPNIEDVITSTETIKEFMFSEDKPICDIFKPYLLITTESGDESALTIEDTITHGIKHSPINVTIYPYEQIDSNTKRYIPDSELDPNQDTFFNDYQLHLSASIKFVKQEDSVENLCVYGKFSFGSINEEEDVLTTYNNLYGIQHDERGYYVQQKIMSKQLGKYLINNIYYSIPTSLNQQGNFKNENNEIVNWIDSSRNLEDYDDDLDEQITYPNGRTFSPIKITIQLQSNSSTISNPTHEIKLEQEYEIIDHLESFSFPLNGLFDSWNEFPEMIFGRIIWKDDLIGISTTSNLFTITKDDFKFLIDNDNNEYLDLDNMKVNKNITLIDSLNCSLTTESTTVENKYSANTPKIIIKPIFYKVNDLQTISLVNGVSQNIGINLNDYLSKVDTFKISMDGNIFTEIARNDAYVIFSINSSYISNTSGIYHLLNEDDDYISSGKYIVS